MKSLEIKVALVTNLMEKGLHNLQLSDAFIPEFHTKMSD